MSHTTWNESENGAPNEGNFDLRQMRMIRIAVLVVVTVVLAWTALQPRPRSLDEAATQNPHLGADPGSSALAAPPPSGG